MSTLLLITGNTQHGIENWTECNKLVFPLEDPVYLPLLKSFFFSLPEDEERNLSAGLDNVIELMVEAESEGEEGEDEGIGDETGVYYSDKSDATICRFAVTNIKANHDL